MVVIWNLRDPDNAHEQKGCEVKWERQASLLCGKQAFRI
jgi:hypothetical protein